MSMRAFGWLMIALAAACSASHRESPRRSPEPSSGQSGSSAASSGQPGSSPARGTLGESAGCYEFGVHGDDQAAPFAIQPGEQIHVFYYRAPWTEEVEAIHFESALDAADAIYGWSLYSVPNARFAPGEHEWAIGSWSSSPETRLLARGAAGAWSWRLPEDVALRLPAPNATLAVEWHHLNVSNSEQHDRSVVRVCTVPASTRPRAAELTVLGTEDLNGIEGMPPGEHTFAGACIVRAAHPLQLLAISPRLHGHGVGAELTIEHPDGRSTLAHDAPFQSTDQRFYPVALDLHPGDRLVTRCSYRNSSEYASPWGVSVWQENCYLLTLTTPGGLRTHENGLWAIDNTCLWDGFGSP